MPWYVWAGIGVGIVAAVGVVAVLTAPIWVWFFWKGDEE